MKSSSDSGNMTFFGHIDELRSRLLKVIVSIVFFSLLFYGFSDYILYILEQPKIKLLNKVNLQVLTITSMFMIKIYISFVGGVMASMPVIMYQLWKFVSPAVEKPINSSIILLFIMSSLFFVIGSYFSYSMIVPLSISFFTSITGELVDVQYNITLESYSSYVISMLLVGGLIFQLPVVTIIFRKLEMIDHNSFKHRRRYAILWIFIIAAILTPPDPFSQILFVIPLILLYEMSIIILRIMR